MKPFPSTNIWPMATSKKAPQKKAVKKTASKPQAVKKAAAKKSATPAKKAAKPKAPKKVVDIIDDFVDREALAKLAQKVDDAVNQDKIQPVVEQAQAVVAGATAEAKKKISWLKRLFGKK